MINSSLSSSVKVAPLPKNEYDFAVSMQHRLNTPIQVHSVAKPDGSKLAILNDRRVSVCFACSKYYQGPHSSREVGIRFTQVAPICSVRGWRKNTGISRNWRRISAPRRHVGHT